MKKLIFIFLLTINFSAYLFSQESEEFNTILMKSTYLIKGYSENGKINEATAFLIGKPFKNSPDKVYAILVTAKHVLDNIVGENAYLNLRFSNSDSSIQTSFFPFKIRNKNENLYISHPEDSIDISVMYVALPFSYLVYSILSLEYLADDDYLKSIEFHPGDEVFCLGYPYGFLSDKFGYPILTSGKIASYPLLPSNISKRYLVDINIHEGNSGGPVYLYHTNRLIHNEINTKVKIQRIIGLLSADISVDNQPIRIAEVVPSFYILETIKMLKDLD